MVLSVPQRACAMIANQQISQLLYDSAILVAEGTTAHTTGIAATANPYQSAGDERFLWLKGWLDAAAKGRLS
jgi:ribosome modulation factor